jgi:hypothetical protein
MIGMYDKDWVIRKDGKIVAMIYGFTDGDCELAILTNTLGTYNYFAMMLAMLEQKLKFELI